MKGKCKKTLDNDLYVLLKNSKILLNTYYVCNIYGVYHIYMKLLTPESAIIGW